jgi:DNA-binding GntR family transcriptional regulator
MRRTDFGPIRTCFEELEMLDKSFPQSNSIATSQTDVAYTILHAAIINCDLAPGLEVSEAILSKQYDLGKGGIRIALARLRQQGLVAVAARRGYQIMPVTLRGVRDVFEMRRVLEPSATGLAVGKVNLDQLANLNEICKAGYQAENPDNLSIFMQVHRQFHMLIINASGNQLIASTLDNLWDQTSRLLNFTHMHVRKRFRMIHDLDHDVLVEALSKGDRIAAEIFVRKEIIELYDLIAEDILASESTLEPPSKTLLEQSWMKRAEG